MINFDNISNLYFLGIGGIGMSALARFAHASGKNVAGYDLTETALTRKLADEGVAVHYTDDINQLPNIFQPINTLVVRTPAVPESHGEYQALKARAYQIVKRSELLGFLTDKRECIAVAGTHGKTSVSTMIAHLLHQSDLDMGAFLGGISRNFESNLVLPKSNESLVVTEADEFDRSFLQLNPTLAIVTSLDPDHLDIYGDFDSLKSAFGAFLGKVNSSGKVLINKRVALNAQHYTDAKVFTYSIEEKADFTIDQLKIDKEAFVFDLITPFGKVENISMKFPGRINLENMTGALAAAILVNADARKLKRAVESYSGVQRRFDVRIKSEEIVYIDDYAHHPRELEAIITSVKELYREKKVLGVFQPHLFSRTNDFAAGFAESLDLLDDAILLPIYPAREKPMPGVSAGLIFDKMKLENKSLCERKELLNELEKKDFEVLITMGAGNIDQEVEAIEKMLRKKYSV